MNPILPDSVENALRAYLLGRYAAVAQNQASASPLTEEGEAAGHAIRRFLIHRMRQAVAVRERTPLAVLTRPTAQEERSANERAFEGMVTDALGDIVRYLVENGCVEIDVPPPELGTGVQRLTVRAYGIDLSGDVGPPRP